MTQDTTPNAFKPGEADLPSEIAERISRRQRAMGPAYRLSYSKPLHFVRGEGVMLYDEEGQDYLDFYNNVVSLGHCHPKVVEAMSQQARMLCTNTRYLHDTVIEYSERLTNLFPEPLSHAMFTCTGSEANDLACRIAQLYTGGDGFIISEFAYHGTTALIASLSANLGPKMALGRNVRTVPAPMGKNAEEVATVFAHHVEAAIADLIRHGIKPAGLLVDTLFSSDGVFPDPPGFLTGAVEAIRSEGGVFIADEVQPGFARTGDSMWGFERHGVVPDIVTLGKPMGNGYPMAGMIVRPDIVAEFGANARYFNTFAGNTVAAANGLAVLDVIREDQLLDNSKRVGAYLKSSLETLKSDYFGDIRGAGLFVGVDVVSDELEDTPDPQRAAQIVNILREKRVLISLTGKHENVLKIRPPLITTQEQVDQFLFTLSEVLGALQ